MKTFPCTVSAFHQFGLIDVRCPALGHRALFVTDDFGNLVEVTDPTPFFVHAAN